LVLGRFIDHLARVVVAAQLRPAAAAAVVVW
jgi:hypothetical protein